MWIATSCGKRGGQDRWGPELDLGGGQPLDNDHGGATVGTKPKRFRFLGHGCLWFCRWQCNECCEAKGQQSGAPAVGEEAEVADANEALGEQMQQETAQELIERQGHQFLLIVVSRVAPTKSDLAVGQRDQSMIGDGHAMGVAAQILEHIFGAAEGRFGVDDPVLSEQWPQPGSEDLGLREQRKMAGKMKLAMLKGRFETSDELAAKHPSEYLDGEEEVRARSNPAGVMERESAGGNNTMDMRMKLELLVPGVKHAEEADLSSEMSGVASDFEKSFCAGTKQQTIDYFFVLQGQRSQLRRQSKDHMDVGHREQFFATCLDPAFAGAGLTLRTMAIATAVV
jgi:hypothetical protein